MNADKVAMRIQQQVSGIRVEVLNRGYAELEELRVVYDWTNPHPWLVDKVRSLMAKHSFYNTHVNDVRRFICGAFNMVFARATLFGIQQLECMARESREEIRQGAKELCPASRAILTALMTAGGVMTVLECFHAVTCDGEIQHHDFARSLPWLCEHKFVVSIYPNRSGIEKLEITRRGRNALKYCN